MGLDRPKPHRSLEVVYHGLADARLAAYLQSTKAYLGNVGQDVAGYRPSNIFRRLPQ